MNKIENEIKSYVNTLLDKKIDKKENKISINDYIRINLVNFQKIDIDYYFKSYKELIENFVTEIFSEDSTIYDIKQFFHNMEIKIRIKRKNIKDSGIEKEFIVYYSKDSIYVKKIMSDVILKLTINKNNG